MDIVTRITKSSPDAETTAVRLLREWNDVEKALFLRGWDAGNIMNLYLECHSVRGNDEHI